jgi:translocation and assembly module TamB
VSALRYRGGFVLDKGEIVLRGSSAPITDVRVQVSVDNDEIRLDQATARMGSGSLKITGSAPLRGFELGAARAVITARELNLPLGEGVKSVADADLVATWEPPGDSGSERSLPRIAGDLTLRSFEYTRPVIHRRHRQRHAARQTHGVRGLRPRGRLLEIDIRTEPIARCCRTIHRGRARSRRKASRCGTNQRLPTATSHRQVVTFACAETSSRCARANALDNLTRIAPQVDVTAVTEYRRYSESSNEKNAAASSSTSSSGGSATQGGHWRITMHAHGDADKLKIDLTSDPALAQDDIFLLLTVGLTRAELDQSQSASVGESVALEALGTLSGADRAVTEALPVIDEFRFGSSYSSRTGRTEPTVTIGKRLTDRVRANVTTGLAESREVRSNLEWRLSNRVSVESSYDNVNDISSSALGNLGADVRWRLEFE